MRYITIFKLTLFLLLITLAPLSSHAHKVRIFAWEESGTIKTEVKFSGGRPAKNAKIVVTNAQDKQELLTGKTDSKGLFTFAVPEAARKNQYNLEITVNSGDGHKNSWLLDAQDYLQIAENSPKQQQPSSLPPVPPLTAHIPTSKQQKKSTTLTISEGQLSQIIESALDKKLGPIKRSLAEQQDKPPSLQDILGGIGYILGLAGIAAYFKSRKEKS